MKVGLIGGVNSSFITLKKLVEHQINITDVFGYEPSEGMIVSGYNNFNKFCNANNIKYHPFTRINDQTEFIQKLKLDALFVVGLSQLVCDEIIESPTLGCIGFHPTLLPKGRGRAPLAWLIHEVQPGAANFFVITDVADAGPIFIQEPFEVEVNDDALVVENKILESIEVALDKWLPELKKDIWDPVPQNELETTEFGVRKPDDGLIFWNLSAYDIIRIIKAAAAPHPGSYTYLGLNKIVINKAYLEENLTIKGCVGRILKIRNDHYLVQTGSGLIWIHDFNLEIKLKVGDRLGYLAEDEIFQLKNDLNAIKIKLGMINE
ncbi:formyl transferase [Colwellia sp. MB3u-70]|uniref:formyltransferase family protein n=1 Tax=unclassified Colwellia TaxID=196834 RepID=UPI0015F4722D|nr:MULTISPECIES: formyltransferase family protein [unclassified Colwellia]MBA6291515.1 formyl transferase [Colwellia sp. MB3u-8]MBA6308965.1 formyl transferase [Colwellia sp. MB3u-70]